MTNFIANDLIIVRLPKQFNWQVFNLIDNSLLFTGNENECKIFCKEFIINNHNLKFKVNK